MKKTFFLLGSIVILYAKNTDMCISNSGNTFTLRIDNKIIHIIEKSSEYILINNKYKAYHKGYIYDGLCDIPTTIYQNKSYTYKINNCATADRSFISVSNIYGLRSEMQCEW